MFQIRPATIEDLTALVDLSVALAHETEGKQLTLADVTAGVRAVLENPAAIVLVAEEEDGTVVGEIMMGGREWSEWTNSQNCWLTSIYVRADRRGLKVGKALYEAVREIAKSETPRVLRIRGCVHQLNEEAQKAHEKNGFLRSDEYCLFEDHLTS